MRFSAGLREVTGHSEEYLETEGEATVGDILELLSRRYGSSFKVYVYGKEGRIADYVQVLLDGTNVANLRGLRTDLKDDSQIDIVPLVAGG